jgi:replication factor C subunit 3/5
MTTYQVIALLRELYGAGVERLKTEHKVYKVGARKIDMYILNSLYHMELNIADAGTN